ncbi:Sca4 family protein [Candidatus Tisiphia endosymbiont of Nedyus quadrimaculatus]|uniref:Sca4 family protein n=1 Tax=Candidatus Tisiphia endosymbiont of Nedyus quadrimaculatus TaxID=3139332 RepID=UPI00345E77EF
MSLQESEETLSAITQLQKKMKTGQGIFEKANEDLKVLQRDLRDKQIALNTLRENLQEQDNDALKLLEKLWKQQEKIKGHLLAKSADEITQAIQEQNEFIDSELELIKQQYKDIVSNLKLCREFEEFLHEDGKDIDNIDVERRKEFSQLLEGNALLKEDNKKELLEKNLQFMVELNASKQNLEEREAYLIEQKGKLQNKDLADNLAVYVQLKLQELFKEWQAEIEKEIDVILADSPIIVKQYENVKLQEEEIKKIQDQIEQKTQIIEQSKQQEGQWFEELKQLEEKSYPPLSSAKQQQEDPVSHYPILQERANDVEASVKHQIELGKLNTKLDIAEEEAAYKTYQLEQLKSLIDTEKLSVNQERKKHLAVISELQERIGELEREKKEQQIEQQKVITPQDLSLLDELEKALEINAFVKLEARISELTQENNDLKTKLEKIENEKEQLEVLSEEKDLEYSKAKENYAAKLQEVDEELLQLKSEQQERQTELDRTKEKLTGTSEKLLEAEELHGKGSEQAKKLQDQVEELTKVQHQLTTELKETREGAESRIAGLTKEKESATLDLQAARLAYEAMLKEQSEAAAAELQTINEKLSQLKLEQQEKQAELERTREELTGTSEKLLEAEELHGKGSEQAKKLQDQVEELTKVQHQLTTELKETREGAESRIAGLTKEKESATLDLQAARLAYEAMLKEQSEAAAAELQEINKELSQLKLEQQESRSELEKKQQELIIVQESLKAAEQEYGVESKQAKELQAQLGGLTNENNSLKTQLEEIENAKEQLEILSGKKDLEYNYLEAEYEKQQAELKKIQQELTLEKLISDEQYDQNKNFKTQLNKVTDENEGLKSQLEKIKEDTKNQLETLSARKDLEYNALEEKQKGDIDELWGRLEVAQEHAQRIQKDEQARVTELKDKDVRIAELEAKNAALLEQLKKLQIKPEVQGAGIQTDEIAGKEKTSVSTETENITKEFRAVDSQTDNRQKLYQSVGTEYRPRMDSGVSTEEVATNVTKVIVQEQTVPTSIEEQTVDKVLVQNKTKGNVYDDDKILQAFKELSREQVQPIVNKFSLESTSSFAQFAQENVGELSEAFRDSKVLREIENIEQRGYTDIHKKFAAEYKDIEWQEKASGKSFSLQQNGQDVVTINETTLNHDDKNAKYKTSKGEEIKNARVVNIPLSIDMKGACHMSFAVQDTNGRNISKEDAVYLTAHYKNGKLVHLTKPTEIFSCSDDNKSPLYLKRKGKTYTLPVDKSTLEQLEQEVLKNKGEYVGIVKNAQGNIRVKSAAVHGLQPDCVTADPLFKDASQLLHDANATPALDGSLDMKGLAHKKPNRNVGSVGKF